MTLSVERIRVVDVIAVKAVHVYGIIIVLVSLYTSV